MAGNEKEAGVIAAALVVSRNESEIRERIPRIDREQGVKGAANGMRVTVPLRVLSSPAERSAPEFSAWSGSPVLWSH